MTTAKSTRREFLTVLGAAGLSTTMGADAAVNWTGKLRVTQGPMLGTVDDDRALVWARVGGEHDVQIEVTDAEGRIELGPVVRSSVADDYCVALPTPLLSADSRYRYRIMIDGIEDEYLKDQPPTYLRTAPAGPAQFTVAFGSCAKFQDDPVQDVWKGVEHIDPDLFFWLGDNVYIDSLHESVMQECYQRQRDILNARDVLRRIPQLATWDDHDFGLNDHDRRNPVKDKALTVFKQYWANPSYGEADNPGTYYRYQYGGVDFFFLDGRYYRDPNDEPDIRGKTMLGKRQLEWLKEGLAASDAPFKVLVSGSGFSQGKGPLGDSWASHQAERDALFNFIVDRDITGVVLISGDTHVGEFNCIPWSEQGGYDFYELVSSPLAQKTEKGEWTARRPEIRLRQVYARTVNVGVLTFDMTADDPTVTMTLHDEQGLPVWWKPVTLAASELVNGRGTWRSHIDRLSLRRHESWKAGGSYYIPKIED